MLRVQTDEGLRLPTGELAPAATTNDTVVQQQWVDTYERGFRLDYTLTPCS